MNVYRVYPAGETVVEHAHDFPANTEAEARAEAERRLVKGTVGSIELLPDELRTYRVIAISEYNGPIGEVEIQAHYCQEAARIAELHLPRKLRGIPLKFSVEPLAAEPEYAWPSQLDGLH
jgi:hypothetical protein